MDDRDELAALRRLAELEAKAGGAAPVAPAVAPQQQAPGSEPLPSYVDRMKGSLLNLAKGGAMGGPIGLAAAGAGEAMKTIGSAIDRTAYGAGGWVTDKATDMGASPEVAGGLGYATNVGVQAIPVVLGGMGAKKVGEPLVESVAKGTMQSALKPNAQAIVSGDASKAIDTLLREGANVSTGGAAKMRVLVDKLNSEVAAQIAASPAVVDKSHAMSEVYKVLQKFKQQVNPGADTQAILKSWDEFNKLRAATIPVAESQALKQGTYRILADKYAKGGIPAVENEAATQAQMAMARGERIGIEQAIPGIEKLNKREADLINALELVERRAGVAGNRDIAGIAWLAQNPAAMTAFLADRSPAFKSIIARMLYANKGTLPTAAGAGLVGAYEGATQGPPR